MHDKYRNCIQVLCYILIVNTFIFQIKLILHQWVFNYSFGTPRVKTYMTTAWEPSIHTYISWISYTNKFRTSTLLFRLYLSKSHYNKNTALLLFLELLFHLVLKGGSLYEVHLHFLIFPGLKIEWQVTLVIWKKQAMISLQGMADKRLFSSNS